MFRGKDRENRRGAADYSPLKRFMKRTCPALVSRHSPERPLPKI